MRLPDYDHATGRHCGSTSLRNLADYYGWGFDEPTCFGLASGLGFTFFELPDPPHKAFIGRPLYLERAFFHTLGIDHVEREGQSWDEAWADIRELLDDGHPVMLFADIYYLDYYGTDTHFSPHSLLAVGYDDEGVYLSDSEFEEVQYLPTDRLQGAMTSNAMVPLQCRYLAVTDPSITTPVEDAVVAATTTMAEYMFAPDEGRFDPGTLGVQGLAGIQRLVSSMAEWPTLPDPQWTARFAYQNVERRGTGGGAFRGLQRDFFRTVEHPFGESVTEEMAAIAEDWTAVGETLKDASESEGPDYRETVDEVAGDIRTIADREAALYREILDADV
ncbi:BtrH N-terminal domain-containing protein [Halomarina litorea]|uniref:BtrH N-terminal domain-containing protein n=1 Tax=Halomarina litorea TaxID=2961595 RepID=UPI0020C4CDA7|nr:BtrH N-terminal domain-containing protein [Halomarina sp. BCD28]